MVTTAPLDTGAGGEVLRGKDRIYQDEFGHVAGDDREEAGQHVLSSHRHPIKAPAIQQQALSIGLPSSSFFPAIVILRRVEL